MRVFPSNTGEEATINTGTNVLSLTGTAVRNLRDFSQAVADGALADTRKVFIAVFLKSDRANFLIWEATYADGAQTLTMVEELEASGTVGNGTTVQVEVGLSKPLLESTMLDLVTSSSDAAVAAEVNTRYELDISGFSANRNFTLPAPTRAGQVIELYLTAGDDTYCLIPIGDTGITINGGSAATEAFGTGFGRLFQTGEFYRFVSTSTTNWNVTVDGRIGSYLETGLATDITTNTAGTAKKITFTAGGSPDHQRGGCWDNTNDYFTVRRAGMYAIECMSKPYAGVSDQKYYVTRLGDSTGATPHFQSFNYGSGTSYMMIPATKHMYFSVGDTIAGFFIPQEANIGSRGASGVPSEIYSTYISIVEQI